MTTCQDLRTQIFVTPAAVYGFESRPHIDSAMELEYDGMDAIFHGSLRAHTDTGMTLHHAGSAAAGQNLGDNQNQMLLTLELAWTRMELLLLLLVVDDRIMTHYGLHHRRAASRPVDDVDVDLDHSGAAAAAAGRQSDDAAAEPGLDTDGRPLA